MSRHAIRLETSSNLLVAVEPGPHDTGTVRVWEGDLNERYGEPRVCQGPSRVMAEGAGGWHERVLRECWAWFPFPSLSNHNVALDKHDGYWTIRAGSPGRSARAKYNGEQEPPDSVVRHVLIAAGLLEG